MQKPINVPFEPFSKAISQLRFGVHDMQRIIIAEKEELTIIKS
jgi:hypothetical protein